MAHPAQQATADWINANTPFKVGPDDIKESWRDGQRVFPRITPPVRLSGPGDPRNDGEAFEALVVSEAEAILAECESVAGAEEFDLGYEPLVEKTGHIINIVARTMLNPHFKTSEERIAYIGEEVLELVIRAALKVAKFKIDQREL